MSVFYVDCNCSLYVKWLGKVDVLISFERLTVSHAGHFESNDIKSNIGNIRGNGTLHVTARTFCGGKLPGQVKRS